MKKRGTNFIIACCLSLTLQLPCRAEADRTVLSVYSPEGSAPPQEGVSSCIAELNGQRYSKVKVEECVKALSGLPFVKRIRVQKSKSSGRKILLEFKVESPPLTNKTVTFGTDPSEESALTKWLNSNSAILKAGEPFRAENVDRTAAGIKQFYATRGILAAVTPVMNLDYDAGTAQTEFKITKGPSTPPLPAMPPYGPWCQDPITAIDESQLDDRVPGRYIESRVKLIAAYACYTPEAAKQDLDMLKSLPFLESVEVVFTGNPGRRQVSYRLKGKPLKVRHVNLEGYGQPLTCLETVRHEIKMRSGDTYSDLTAFGVIQDLEKACTQKDHATEVTEQDALAGQGEIDVTFTVLTVPRMSLLIHGKADGLAGGPGSFSMNATE